MIAESDAQLTDEFRRAMRRVASTVNVITVCVNGQPMGAIPGTVTSQGEPGSIDVRQARTQLVDQ